MKYLTEAQIRDTLHLPSRKAAKVLGVGKSTINDYRKHYNVTPEQAPVTAHNAKVLILDIESKPMMGYFWQPRVDYIPTGQIVDDGGLLCFAYKWLGQPQTEFVSEWEHGTERMVREAHGVLSTADIVITYNGDRFDLKRLNNEFLRLGMAPPKPYKSIDLYKTNRAQFDLPYKKLDYIAQAVGVGEKTKHQGFDLWLDCMARVPEALELMEEYNRQDVVLTESLYVKLLPWLKTVPHMGMYTTDSRACPYCGGDDVLVLSGETYTYVQSYDLYQCEACEGWSRSNKPIGEKLGTRRVA